MDAEQRLRDYLNWDADLSDEQGEAVLIGADAIALLREIEPKYLKVDHQRRRAALLTRAGRA